MIDATQLADIERRWRGYRGLVDPAEIDALFATAREAIALRKERDTWKEVAMEGVRLIGRLGARLDVLCALIEAHNAGCDSDCASRRRADGYAGVCAVFRRQVPPRDCPDCPRLDRIELPGNAKETK